MNGSFNYSGLPVRVIFGSGTIATLPDEVNRMGLKRALVLSTPEQSGHAQALAAMLGDSAVGIEATATMHTPVDVTVRVLERVVREGVDGLIAVGGGSTTGLAKALALRTDLPQIIIPTTYAGSEMTPILGQTENGVKTTQSSPRILPELTIYDVDLTMSLPVALSGTSGMNAIAHAVEALYARDRNPIVDLMAVEGIAALGRALPRLAERSNDRPARVDALYGAWLCGVCLGSVGMSLHHKLCHAIGGTFDLPHAETHTVILPYAVRYNALAAPEAMAKIGGALGASDAADGLFALARQVGAKASLAELGMPEDGISKATDVAMMNSYWNPQPVERDGIYTLIEKAWRGERP